MTRSTVRSSSRCPLASASKPDFVRRAVGRLHGGVVAQGVAVDEGVIVVAVRDLHVGEGRVPIAGEADVASPEELIDRLLVLILRNRPFGPLYLFADLLQPTSNGSFVSSELFSQLADRHALVEIMSKEDVVIFCPWSCLRMLCANLLYRISLFGLVFFKGHAINLCSCNGSGRDMMFDDLDKPLTKKFCLALPYAPYL